MRTKVAAQGLWIGRQWLQTDVEEVEVVTEQDWVLITPIIMSDPILELGTHPIVCESLFDAAEQHDLYLYGAL